MSEPTAPTPSSAQGQSLRVDGKNRWKKLRWLLPIALIPFAVDVVQGLTHRSPPAPKITVSGREVVSESLGLRLLVPEPWTFLPAQAGVEGALMQNPESGAVLLLGAESMNPPNEPLNVTIDKLVEGRREKWGGVRDVERSDGKLGSLASQSVAFSITGPNGPVRCQTTMALKGSNVLSTSCSGAEPTFGVSQKSCFDLLRGLQVPAQ